jgi:mRNA interferase MazF
MVVRKYIPDRLDIVWLDFEPSQGREMSKVRPALVVSPKYYNERAELMLACPITSISKGYPFEVPIHTPKVKGVVVADQIRSVSWSGRKVKFIAKAPPGLLDDVREKINTLMTVYGV